MSAPNWFNARKAAQLAAFFSNKQGDSINVLKLTKLIYLADREHMEKYGWPITDDKYVSMPHGPVNSITNNFMNGEISDAGWDEFVSDRLDYSVGAVRKYEESELDEFSPAELETLAKVWEKFGHMSKWEIRDWTHKHCPEWEDPNGSAAAIPFERILKFLGREDAEQRAEHRASQAQIDNLFAKLAS